MTTAAPALTTARQVLALPVNDAAVMVRRSAPWVRWKIREFLCPTLHVAGRTLILVGDLQAIDGIDCPDLGADGRSTIANAWRDQRTVELGALASAVCVSRRTLHRLVGSGDLPAFRADDGSLRVAVDAARRWLLDHRVPALWE